MSEIVRRKKQIGFILSVAVTIYFGFKLIGDIVFNLDGGHGFIYICLFVISLFTIISSLSNDNETISNSHTILIILSIVFFLNGFLFLGHAATLNTSPIDKYGIIAYGLILNAIPNIVLLIESKKVHKIINSACEIISIIAVTLFILYISGGYKQIYLSFNLVNTRLVNGVVMYLEKNYHEDITVRSYRGHRCEAYKFDDPELPESNTYCVNVYWKKVQITAFVEIRPNGSMHIYKENFQSCKFGYLLKEYLRKYGKGLTGVDVVYEDFVSEPGKDFKDLDEYLAFLPEGKKIDLVITTCDDYIEPYYKDSLREFVNSLPAEIEGNIIFKFTHSVDGKDVVFSKIIIPYAHHVIYLSRIVPEDDNAISNGAAILLGINPEYHHDEIMHLLYQAVFEEHSFGDTDMDFLKLEIADPINIYKARNYNNREYLFDFEEIMYPIIYKGNLIALAGFVRENDLIHMELIYDDMIVQLSDHISEPLAICIDAEFAYVFNGQDLIRLPENIQMLQSWSGRSDVSIIDKDPSTDTVESNMEISDYRVEFVNIIP